jgi:cystathionine beta-lyase
MEKFISQLYPEIKVIKREGTPTVWLDFRNMGISTEKIFDFLLNKAKIVTVDGKFFGDDGEGFQRMSLGFPRSIMEKAMNNLKLALKSLS